jgi:hypothetical protein
MRIVINLSDEVVKGLQRLKKENEDFDQHTFINSILEKNMPILTKEEKLTRFEKAVKKLEEWQNRDQSLEIHTNPVK